MQHAQRARAIFDQGRGDAREALTILAEAFECLHGVPGVRPFAAERLDKFLRGGRVSSMQRDCAAFILRVYKAPPEWGHPFDAIEALFRWDRAARAAFAEWARAPWWA